MRVFSVQQMPRDAATSNERQRHNIQRMKQKEYKPTRQEKSREEMAAIGTMIIVTVVALILVINLIYNI